jgi:hypothetical protein
MVKSENCLTRILRWMKGTVFFGDTALAVSLWAGLLGAASGTLSLVNLAHPKPLYPWEAYAPLGAAIAAYAAGGMTMLAAYLSAKSVKRSQEKFEVRVKRLEQLMEQPPAPESVILQHQNSPVIYRAKGYRLKGSTIQKSRLSDVA